MVANLHLFGRTHGAGLYQGRTGESKRHPAVGKTVSVCDFGAECGRRVAFYGVSALVEVVG